VKKAKVVVTFTDDDDGGTKVKVESDPPFPGPAAEDQTMTPAQSMAVLFFEYLRQQKEQVK
jgi:hypothetical protein